MHYSIFDKTDLKTRMDYAKFIAKKQAAVHCGLSFKIQKNSTNNPYLNQEVPKIVVDLSNCSETKKNTYYQAVKHFFELERKKVISSIKKRICFYLCLTGALLSTPLMIKSCLNDKRLDNTPFMQQTYKDKGQIRE